ncbi:hypothetical protein [Dongia deserti]|uniref:hypothetical protein n=1 Tax=Dongia deserti TaxID=2268030 RepID=UPI000E646049|nr:hypothetical protein [Dongia deserti]
MRDLLESDRRAKLQLVWSAPPAPPAESLAGPIAELGCLLHPIGANSAQLQGVRHHEKVKALERRILRGAIHDIEDVHAVLTFLVFDVIGPECPRDEESLSLGFILADRARRWLEAPPPIAPRNPPGAA